MRRHLHETPPIVIAAVTLATLAACGVALACIRMSFG
jgi:predicted small lipoprotein YifL